MDNEITAEEIARHYSAMGDSVDLINAIIAGDYDDNMEADERQDCVNRNVEHLQIMVAKDFWSGESMTAANAAITASQGYTAT